MNDTNITRRTAFVAGALGAVAAAGLAKTAQAATPTKAQKANIKIVEDFIKAWNEPDKSVAYLADDASVRMEEDKPPVVGPAAVGAAFKTFMGHGETIDVKILSTFAEGPVVTNTRIDTLKTPGKPDQAFKVVGVFVVKKGKIKEWTDYLDA
ncbi:MAG: epoxide hydrolase [Rhodospirillales bacterium]|nr:epoxide hydrolase [Rhodospirillales bacterium]